MKIIGLNGYTDRGHDGGATLIIDGKVVFAIEEEKLINKRHAYDCYPKESINTILNEFKLSLDDIDLFVYGWNYETIYKMIGNKNDIKKKMCEDILGDAKYENKFIFSEHHIAHALSSFYPSKFKKALSIVVDGQGEYMATSVYLCEKNKFPKLVYETPVSLGYFYSAITCHIGFRIGEEGKTMGLASYGKPIYYDILKRYINENEGKLISKFIIKKKSKDEEKETINKWSKILNDILPKREGSIENVDDEIIPYANLASSAQKLLEDILINFTKYYINKYNIHRICLSGGVCLNCSANSRIEEMADVKDVFIQPAANDGGVSLGAAMYGSLYLGEKIKKTFNIYSGTMLLPSEIETELKRLKLNYTYIKKIEDIIAEKLSCDEIVAIYNGRIEFGPRALGNRSLLANASNPDMIIKLNTLKGREVWRPLAPIVLYKDQTKYFNYKKKSLYMLKNTYVKGNKIPSVTHIDNTARIQTVTKKSNEHLYKILKSYTKISGTPVLINTSFNVKGEPLVNSVENAVISAKKMHISFLAIGNYFIEL